MTFLLVMLHRIQEVSQAQFMLLSCSQTPSHQGVEGTTSLICCTCAHEAVSEQADCSIVVPFVTLWLYLLHSGAVWYTMFCLHELINLH